MPNPPQRAQSRIQAVSSAGARKVRKIERPTGIDGIHLKTSEYFGVNTFGFDLMEKTLPPKDVETLRGFAVSNTPLDKALANKVANAVREWAVARGATHYCHWFQPQTGTTAEKHDSFFSFDKKNRPLENFTGKELIQSEPDASSFPSGGRRSTFEARGYTAWDASSPMFLMESENGNTLCIPSIFISYSGESLDKKTPLLRSISALSKKATESLHLLGHKEISHVIATAGAEQEYFVVDEALFNLRPDLLLAGRTLLGRSPPRGQQLEDHYFGSIKPRILSFMMECEQELYKLGVPCKTRHNEVAPSQCEFAPIFEQANLAADHNQLVMEIIRTVARRHQLVAVFHEKPYAGINGSGKHVNWSLADSQGSNLLEPGDTPQDSIRFLFFLAATIKAVHDNPGLLRVAVASAGNDFRLGANEAPPAIMSVFLGETLTEVLDGLLDGKPDQLTQRVREINVDLARVPVIARDNTDRNRTSPFAFTGNKFEFRAVGASASISPALTYVNAAVACALDEMNTLLRNRGGAKPDSEHIISVIQEVVRSTKKIRFEGNNYSAEWHKEAESRGLPNYRNTPESLVVLKDPNVQDFLSKYGIHTKEECQARFHVQLERYIKIRLIEMETMHELLSTHVAPAATAQVRQVSSALNALKEAGGKVPVDLSAQVQTCADLAGQIARISTQIGKFLDNAAIGHDEERLAQSLCTEGMALIDAARKVSDELEILVDDQLWSLPKYRELLYMM